MVEGKIWCQAYCHQFCLQPELAPGCIRAEIGADDSHELHGNKEKGAGETEG